MRAVTSHGVGMTLFTFTPLQSAKLRYYWYLPSLSHKDYLRYWVETLKLAVQFASRKPQRPHPRTKEE